jgi:chromosome segregation protein
MTYIKKVVMQGFKSFARKTEISLEDAMNVIVGPNGSGKSNITDALCFVLGRLSIKSIRAAKAANLLFSGNKTYKGSQEASVELVFDNRDNTFGIDSSEVTIKRIVRKNGGSIYKINNQTKTRQELLELLAQAGIDPNGFNIVLQGEIQSLVKATPDERRKIIEEVAGISIYETRKHKSLRELEKTEEKLKEVSTVLKERKSYLRNLDKERSEALIHKKLEETISRCKVTILSKNKMEKEKEIQKIQEIIENHNHEIEIIRGKIKGGKENINELQDKTTTINKSIQSSTNNDQERLYKEISDLKAELAGLKVREENFGSRIINSKEKAEENKEKIKDLNKEVSKVLTSSPEIEKEKKINKILQEKFDKLERERRRFYILKSELSTLEHQKTERERKIIEENNEIKLIEANISSLFEEIKYTKSQNELEDFQKKTKEEIKEIENNILERERENLEREREIAIFERDIKRERKLKEEIFKLRNCPICKQEVNKDHKHKISTTSDKKINFSTEELEKNIRKEGKGKEEILNLKNKLLNLRKKLNELDIDEIKLKGLKERKERINYLKNLRKESSEGIEGLIKKIYSLKTDFEKLKNCEEEYDNIRLKLQELSFVDIDVDTNIAIKKRELNRLNTELKGLIRDIEDSELESKKISTIIYEKNKLTAKKEIEEQKLYEEFQKLFGEKNELQDKQKAVETEVIGLQHTSKNLEEKIHHNKVRRAEYAAQIDSIKEEISEFGSAEIINLPIDQIKDKLQKSQFKISGLGNVNMRSLEAYDKTREQCDLINAKVETIIKEKEQIEKIIAEIDKKKKKSFMKALISVNEYFTRNFSQLSRKGEVFLELENKRDPFEGGLNILVKASRGRYFDVTSLSGGEKTMVALALIFAIQEYSPYCFYILDEIDAALDKHNSELLAALIKKYMKTGQYIIITHNDTLITEATNLYGVSMQENISKIISLKV